MNKLAPILILLLIAAAAAWWWNTGNSTSQPETPVQAAPQADNVTASMASAASEISAASEVSAASEAASAPTDLQIARAAKAAAENELARLDAELAEVEAYIARLEASGLNPVDFSEEGMTKMQPILAAYLDVEVRLAMADAAIEKALAEAQAQRQGQKQEATE